MNVQNQCPECKSSVRPDAGMCEACGFQMRRLWYAPRRVSPWKYRMAAILTGFGVALAHYLMER